MKEVLRCCQFIWAPAEWRQTTPHCIMGLTQASYAGGPNLSKSWASFTNAPKALRWKNELKTTSKININKARDFQVCASIGVNKKVSEGFCWSFLTLFNPSGVPVELIVLVLVLHFQEKFQFKPVLVWISFCDFSWESQPVDTVEVALAAVLDSSRITPWWACPTEASGLTDDTISLYWPQNILVLSRRSWWKCVGRPSSLSLLSLNCLINYQITFRDSTVSLNLAILLIIHYSVHYIIDEPTKHSHWEWFLS